MPDPQIVALGGGGFTMEPDNPRLDRFILDVCVREQPRICFVPTASGDAESYILRFYQAFSGAGCRPCHLSLFQRTVVDLRQFLCAQDIVYVGGGNTVNLLAVWRAHGLDVALRDAWKSGVLLCGLSAGSLCWYEGGVTDSFGPTLAPLRDGLAFLPGSHCPHYDSEASRRPSYHACIAAGLPGGIAAEDGVGLLYRGTRLERVVTSRPRARAYRVEMDGGRVVETPIEPDLL